MAFKERGHGPNLRGGGLEKLLQDGLIRGLLGLGHDLQKGQLGLDGRLDARGGFLDLRIAEFR